MEPGVIDGLLHCQSLIDISAHESFDHTSSLAAQGLICVAVSIELRTLNRLVQILYATLRTFETT